IGNPSLNHRYRKGFYSLFKTLQQNPCLHIKKGQKKNRGFYPSVSSFALHIQFTVVQYLVYKQTVK
ncbi:hypothetical protein, partial [Enterococcus hirae]|uniref:hypothetical protein n=1 Tax=Enterococcus hirae TaxID=1354 RepID=UPI002890B360